MVTREASNHTRRVVVTGIGMVTPLGTDRETSWQGLIEGRSGAGPITLFDASDLPVRFGCEVPDFDPTVVLERKTVRRNRPLHPSRGRRGARGRRRRGARAQQLCTT